MSITITPVFSADTVTLQNISIQYHPEWDGTKWDIITDNIEILGLGVLGGNNGSVSSNISTNVLFTELPIEGQNALQQLYAHIEQALADEMT